MSIGSFGSKARPFINASRFLPATSIFYLRLHPTCLFTTSKMDYQTLYSEASNETNLEDSIYRDNNTVHTDSVHGITKWKAHFYPWTHCLFLYSVILTTLFAVLIATMLITYIHGNLDLRAQKAASTTTFGRNFRFMSVDHKYDGLREN